MSQGAVKVRLARVSEVEYGGKISARKQVEAKRKHTMEKAGYTHPCRERIRAITAKGKQTWTSAAEVLPFESQVVPGPAPSPGVPRQVWIPMIASLPRSTSAP